MPGAGKSTLVKFIVEALQISQSDVCYIAYTGKAALVLKEKGCPNSMTAHRLLYKSFPRRDGTFYHKPKRPLDYPYKLIILDEVSMFPKEMWELLLSHGVHIIALGDPGQLPPIGDDNGILAQPHVFLDEIMRQAQESEIIRLTMDIRAGKPLQLFKGNEVQIIDKSELVDGMLLWADQIICAKNETRRNINQLIRQYKYGADVGFAPVNGDKVICLRNDWDRPNSNGDVMVNGMIGTITNIQYGKPNHWLETDLIADVVPDGYEEDDMFALFDELHIDYKLLTSGEPTVNKKNFKRFPPVIKPKEFDYGYCITCHKSQGSEYDKVLVFEEFLRGGDHARWLYTACTRAKKKLVIVKA
jgi:exodeoxyribonuclease-5